MKKITILIWGLVLCFSTLNINAQCPISASFSYSINNGYKVQFTSTKKTPNHYWSFGVKNGYGNTSNPTFTYPGPGTYTVCHDVFLYDSITRKYCSDSVCQKITIPKMCDANASFSLVQQGDSVKFTNNKQSSNVVYWGDGSSSQNVYQKWHKYSKAGQYTICQIASGYDSSTNSYCEDTICKTITIKSNPCNANATFYYQIQGNKIYISSAQNGGSHYYSFGDGNTSRSASPVHTYSKAGTYTICHDISYYDSINNKWCSDSLCKTVTIKSSSCSADAKFSVYHSGGGKIYLTPTQRTGTHYWSFGDGSSSSQNYANHTYKKVGTYNICHTVTYYDSINNKYCSDSTCLKFTYTNCNVNAYFVLNKLQHLTYSLTPAQKTGQHYWSISDKNATYNTSNPTHTFTKAGNYWICHVVSYYDSLNNQWCSDSTCKTVTISSNNPCNLDASFAQQHAGNGYYNFFATHRNGTHYWDFGDGNSSQLSAPGHTYKKPGKYTVCHSISYYDSINNKWCSDSTCKTIYYNSCNVTAAFSYKILQGNTYRFIPNQSIGTHFWVFESNKTSNATNPVYTFSKPGTYYVCHEISYYDSINNRYCSDSTCLKVVVPNNSPCNADFNDYDSANTKYFIPTNYSRTAKHYWKFGDGNTSAQNEPIHTYKKPGTYNVCHYVSEYDPNNRLICLDSICKKVIVGTKSTQNFELNSSLVLYPNPVKETLNLSFNRKGDQTVVINILDPTGKLMLSVEDNNASKEKLISIPTQALPTGIYLLQIQTGSSQVTRNFIKQ